jgi:hypothetical protein
VLDRVAQAATRGAEQVLARGAQALARSTARYASKVLDHCTRPLPAAPLAVRRRYLIAMPEDQRISRNNCA